MIVVLVLLLALVIFLVFQLLTSGDVERGNLQRRYVVTSDPPKARYEGPAKWTSNVEFSAFTRALSSVVAQQFPSGQNDRKRLAKRAGLSPSTLEKVMGGSNPTLQTLWKLSQARQIPLSELIRLTEDRLYRRPSAADAYEERPSVH